MSLNTMKNYKFEASAHHVSVARIETQDLNLQYFFTVEESLIEILREEMQSVLLIEYEFEVEE